MATSFLGGCHLGGKDENHHLWVLSDGTSRPVSDEQPLIGPPEGGWASSLDILLPDALSKGYAQT